MRPFYEDLSSLGVLSRLREFVKKLIEIRNGFDHAWTAAGPDKRRLLENVKLHAESAKENLIGIINILKETGKIYN